MNTSNNLESPSTLLYQLAYRLGFHCITTQFRTVAGEVQKVAGTKFFQCWSVFQEVFFFFGGGGGGGGGKN